MQLPKAEFLSQAVSNHLTVKKKKKKILELVLSIQKIRVYLQKYPNNNSLEIPPFQQHHQIPALKCVYGPSQSFLSAWLQL